MVLFGWAHVDVLKKSEVDKDLSSLVHASIMWNKVKTKKNNKVDVFVVIRLIFSSFFWLIEDICFDEDVGYTIRIRRKIIKMCHNFMTC